jgi:hypothetical protein
MRYTTEFTGKFDLNKPLSSEHRAYLAAFAETRRMKRDATQTVLRPDPLRIAVGLPIGDEGGYFVGASGNTEDDWQKMRGQEHTPDVTDYNHEPAGQPGLWCQWVPTEDGSAIEWDGGEKFYSYVEWIQYLITHFLAPWGYVLNGTVKWEGESRGDLGRIVIVNNAVSTKTGRVVYR